MSRRAGGSATDPELEDPGDIGAERPSGRAEQTFDPLTGTFESETQTEAAQQRLAEAQQPFSVEFGLERQAEALELAADAQQPTVATDVAQRETQATAALERSDVRQDIDSLADVATETDTRQQLDQELKQRTETETETETEQELFQELENETETEIETRFETESETRRERERDDDPEAQERRPAAPMEESVGAIFADFRDPLTGELLETERENVGVRDI